MAKNGLDVLTKEGCLGQMQDWRVFPIGDCPAIDPVPDGDWIDTDQSSRVGCNAPRPKPKPVASHDPPLQEPPLPSVSRVEAKRRKRRVHKQTRRKRLEQEADGFLAACVQAHDSPPPSLVLPCEVGHDAQEISEVERFFVSRAFKSPQKPIKRVCWNLCNNRRANSE